MTMTRREALVATTAVASVWALGDGAAAPPKKTPAGVASGQHAPVPLPFAAGKLAGLSEKLLVSHHENNYTGAVKNLNKVELELAAVNKDTPGFVVTGLRERELTFTNSVILHEHYFGNLGGSGKPSGAVEKALGAGFGPLARWEELFRATAMGLGGGSGWVILDLNFHSRDLRIYASGGHNQAVAFGQPLLVLDMFEHAYALDYGAAHAKYIDAFFQNVSWDEVNRRYARGLKAAAVLSP